MENGINFKSVLDSEAGKILIWAFFGDAYAMDDETMFQAKRLMKAETLPAHMVSLVLTRLDQFNTLEQADAYLKLIAKCERYYEKARPVARDKFMARIEELKDINSIDGSLKVVVDHLGDRAPTEDEVRMVERYLGIPVWFEKE